MTTIGIKYRGTKEFYLVYSRLIDAALGQTLLPYAEVAKLLRLPPKGHHMARQVGQILGEISEEENRNRRPLLSVLAVSQAGRPGEGFFVLARKLGRLTGESLSEEEEFWKHEREAAYLTWRQP